MAATETLPKPSTTEAPITTASLLLPSLEPIHEIAESVSTQSVAIDITNSLIQAVQPSNSIDLEVESPSEKLIERALGSLIGGKMFTYELQRQHTLQNRYDLRIESRRSCLLNPAGFAAELQAEDSQLTVFIAGTLINIDVDDVLAKLF